MAYPTDLDINLDPHIEFTGLQIQIVSAYSRRDLTNTEDRLIALAGIVERMQASKPGNYLARPWMEGLPTHHYYVPVILRASVVPTLSTAP